MLGKGLSHNQKGKKVSFCSKQVIFAVALENQNLKFLSHQKPSLQPLLHHHFHQQIHNDVTTTSTPLLPSPSSVHHQIDKLYSGFRF